VSPLVGLFESDLMMNHLHPSWPPQRVFPKPFHTLSEAGHSVDYGNEKPAGFRRLRGAVLGSNQ
jgi:hypothetical protein